MSGVNKRNRFLVILIFLIFASAAASYFVNSFYLEEDTADHIQVAVVGPMSGERALIGQSMRRGAEYFAAHVASTGRFGDRKVAVKFYDDRSDPARAKEIAEQIVKDGKSVAVVGHWSSDVLESAAEVYKGKIPLIAFSTEAPRIAGGNDWVFSTNFDDAGEARFLANYVRNVIGQRNLSVVMAETPRGRQLKDHFEKTLNRFGTKLQASWSYDPESPDMAERLDQIAEEISTRTDVAGIFIAGGRKAAARIAKVLRDADRRNLVVGVADLGTKAFEDEVRNVAAGSPDISKYRNKMVFTTPLTFDTANEAAQNFRNGYRSLHGEFPDWIAAYAFDGIDIAIRALRRKSNFQGAGDAGTARNQIHDYLASLAGSRPFTGGISGITEFSSNGVASRPVVIGVYDGDNIISAPTQLEPIRHQGAVENYIAELKKGRVLYVNDRFMYRTNVVYTGVEVHKITDLDFEKQTATLDFSIWFRFTGSKSNPQDVIFTNAVDDIVLKKPVEAKELRGMTYHLYKVKGKFLVDALKTDVSYGQKVIGLSFRHRLLSRNNLLYVVDVLGLGLEGDARLQDRLTAGLALKPTTGWQVDRAWLSQDVVTSSSFGDPYFVGFDAVAPEFSKINYGVVVSEIKVNIKDFIPEQYLIYLAIIGFIFIVSAILMDRKKKGIWGGAYTWVMRVLAWPIFWVSAGNLVLDFAVANFSAQYIEIVVKVYETGWWIIPSWLVVMAIDRFIWRPIEVRSGRNIPNVIRGFCATFVYLIAFCGILAFVFDKELAALLGAGGLIFSIVGLAISAHISNVFSGVIINLERPFKVGDWVKIADLDEGMVTDITWRTIRVLTRDGYTISMPNGKASDSEVHNFTSESNRRITFYVYLSNQHDPSYARPILDKAIQRSGGVLETPRGRARYHGVENIFGQWVSKYQVLFYVDDYANKENISENVWQSIWADLQAENISLSMVGRRGADELREPASDDNRVNEDDTMLDEIIDAVT